MKRVNGRLHYFRAEWFIRTHPYLKGPTIVEGIRDIAVLPEDLENYYTPMPKDDSVLPILESLMYRIIWHVKREIDHGEITTITELSEKPQRPDQEIMLLPREMPHWFKSLWINDVKMVMRARHHEAH